MILVLLLIIHALISCRLDYCHSILYNVPRSKMDRLQRLQNPCARILTKPPRITTVLKKNTLAKNAYNILMLTYKSYYNMAPPYLCELINKKESHVNTRLGTDHHQLIMSPISNIGVGTGGSSPPPPNIERYCIIFIY